MTEPPGGAFHDGDGARRSVDTPYALGYRDRGVHADLDGVVSMKSVLMIAYHYPPEASSSGVLRTLKFSRHLLPRGWTPHVLTLRDSVYPVRDETLVSQIPPEVTVHRVAGWDTARHFAIRGRHLGFMAVPDSYVSWLPFGVAAGLKVVRRTPIHALFSTSPKPTAHLIALALKRRTGVPWVADFRDPWIEEGLYPPPGSLRYRVESRLEAAVIRHADAVVATTPDLVDDLRRRHARVPREKFSVIFNGYDADDFDAAWDRAAPPSVFELIHGGMLTPDYRNPVPLLTALASLLARGEIARPDGRVVFLGAGAYVESADFRDTVTSLGLGDVVQVLARLPHRESLRRLYQAAVLVVLQDDEARALVPAKVFEYLRVGRPILSLTAEGVTPRLLRELGVGVVADPSSPDAIAAALRRLYTDWKAHGVRPPAAVDIGRFARSSLAGELAARLDAVVDGHRALELSTGAGTDGPASSSAM
jgi:glycosyltransferase involved in cell wall biosynthesis